jgi:hypothetical protein
MVRSCLYLVYHKLTKVAVNARNVCSLLTAVAPSSVAEFKDAALEYVCLSLEAVMQNGYVFSCIEAEHS